MATTTAVTPTTSTTDTTSYASGSFTPAASDLLVVFVSASDTVSTGRITLTDSQSLGFSLVTFARKNASGDSIYMFVANALAAASAMTVTFGCPDDAATGSIISILRIAGMSRAGLAAIRQTQIVNTTAAGTPAPAFSAACLTGNVTVGFVANLTNPATITEPASWTEAADVGYATPTQGAQTVFRDSGFTGTTITWGGSTGSAYGLIIAEMDTSALSGLYPDATSVGAAAVLTGTSTSITHVTGSGANMVLFAVIAAVDNSAGRDIISSVTYNSVALKFIGKIADRGGSELFNCFYMLVAPASGSHSLVVNFTANLSISSSVIDVSAISFSGVHQTYPYKLIQTQVSGQTSGTAMSETVTDVSTSDGDYILGAGLAHQSGIVPLGTQTLVVNQSGLNIAGAQGWGVSIRRADIGTSLGWTQSSSDVWSTLGIAIRPATATPTIPFLDDIGRSIVATGASSATITSVVCSGPVNGLMLFEAIYTAESAINVTGVTWNSQAFALLDTQRVTDGAEILVTELWYLKVPVAGTSNLVATFSAAITAFSGHVQVWALVNQANTFGTVAKTSSTAGVSSYSVTVTSQTAAIVKGVYWIWPDTSGYVVPDGSELADLTTGTGPTGVQGQVQAKIGAASVAIGGTIGASGGVTDYNAMGVGINFGPDVGAQPGGSFVDDLWRRPSVMTGTMRNAYSDGDSNPTAEAQRDYGSSWE